MCKTEPSLTYLLYKTRYAFSHSLLRTVDWLSHDKFTREVSLVLCVYVDMMMWLDFEWSLGIWLRDWKLSVLALSGDFLNKSREYFDLAHLAVYMIWWFVIQGVQYEQKIYS